MGKQFRYFYFYDGPVSYAGTETGFFSLTQVDRPVLEITLSRLDLSGSENEAMLPLLLGIASDQTGTVNSNTGYPIEKGGSAVGFGANVRTKLTAAPTWTKIFFSRSWNMRAPITFDLSRDLFHRGTQSPGRWLTLAVSSGTIPAGSYSLSAIVMRTNIR